MHPNLSINTVSLRALILLIANNSMFSFFSDHRAPNQSAKHRLSTTEGPTVFLLLISLQFSN